MVPQKIPYNIMALEVEKLYQKDFPPHDPAIAAHCEYIAEFIRSCGWTEEEYWDRWVKENPIQGLDRPNTSAMN